MKKSMQLIIAGLLVLPLTACSKEKMELASNELTIEYGKTISTELKDYLKNDDQFLKDVKIEGIPDNEQDKDYPSIGEYEITLKNADETQQVKVTVKDTVAPVFKDVSDKYEVEYGSKFDVNGIKAEDLSKVDLSIVGDVDYKKAGTYKVNIVAKDASNNETKKEISIVVKEEEKKETATTSNKKTDSSTAKTTSGSISKKSNNSSSSSTTSKKSNGDSTSNNKTNDKKSHETSNSGSVIVEATEYYCIDGNCGVYKSWNEFQKHRAESGHDKLYNWAESGGGNLELPSDWNY